METQLVSCRFNQSIFFSSHKLPKLCSPCTQFIFSELNFNRASSNLLQDLPLCWKFKWPQSNYFDFGNLQTGFLVVGFIDLVGCLALQRLLSLDKRPLLLLYSLPFSSPRAAVNEEPDYRFIFILAH